MSYITVGKENETPIDIYYEDHGQGKPVIFIHGFPLSGAAWEKEVLSLLKAGFRTITYDRRGFGRSSQPTTGYDYGTFAHDLDAIITQLDLHDVMLVGHSMGTGEIARYMGIYGSKRIGRVVFISPIPPFLLKTHNNPQGVDKQVFDDILSRIAQDRLAYLTEFFADFYNLDKTLGKQVSNEVFQESWHIAAGASPAGTAASVSAWLTDFRGDISEIDVPVLIVQGDADRILPFAVTGKRLHEILKNSRLIVFKGGSHGIVWTHAEEISRELLQFLDLSAGHMPQQKNQSWVSPGFS